MILELLQKRTSVRKFQNKPVPEDVIRYILEAGRLSPSGGNEQPWVFGVVTQPDLIAAIAEISDRQLWIARAPLVIVLCTQGVPDADGGRDIQKDRFPEYAGAIQQLDQEMYWALNQEEHQTKIPGTHMVLAALEKGLGSCWISRFKVRRLAELLHLPAGILPSELLVMGYPALTLAQPKKKELEKIVFYNVFGS